MRKLLSVLSSTLQGGVRWGLLSMALFAATALLAQDSYFQVGDLYYNITSETTVEVTSGDYSNLTTATIPDIVTHDGTIYSVTSIGSTAFFGCSSLTSITIPESVTSIGNSAFSSCSSLTSITIPESVTSIGNSAFFSCSSLTSIVIPNSVMNIGDNAFSYCSALTSPVYNAHCFAYMPTSFEGIYTILEGIKQIAGGAFQYCSSLTSVTIPNSVTSIGSAAFWGCSSLTSITIPNSVTSIGTGAFYGTGIYHNESNWDNGVLYISNFLIETNKNISGTYTIKEGTLLIAGGAFSSCTSLTSITIPNSVSSVGDHAFYRCSSLISVTIPESVTIIKDNAFSSCSSLTSVTIPNSVTSIGDYAFSGCKSLTSITIPNSVTSIGNSAFSSCSSLTSITIPYSVTSIGGYAFSGCESITKTNYTGDIAGWCDIKFGNASANPISNSHNLYINDQEIQDLVIPNTVDSIQNYAFDACYSLKSVTVSSSVKGIGNSTFQNCCFLKKDFVNNSSLDAEENYYWGALVGESEVDGLIIQETTVVGCRKNVTTISIPDYITNIGNNAFYDCSSLTSITIPNSVTSIGNYAFSYCDSLTKTNYTGDIAGWCKIKFGGGSANPICYSRKFYINDKEINDLVIPNTVDSIQNYAFYYCSSLTSVTIPNSVKSIGEGAFSNCYPLTSITMSNSVTSIGKKAFFSCNSLTSITIPNSVTSIGELAFSGCSSLASITIPDSVTYLGDAVFRNCGSLDSITIGNSVTGIGEKAFDNCYSLKSITIPNNVTSIGNRAFYNCSSLTSVSIGNSVKSIGEQAFDNCYSLKSITIPNNVTSIGNRAFYYCSSLTSVSIGNSVKSIGELAFYDCQQLNTLYVEAVNPPHLEEYVFEGCKIKHCYIPCGCVRKYLYDTTNQGWFLLLNEQQIESIEEYDPLSTFGKCGENLEWNYANNKLSITGTGKMLSYYDEDHIDYYRPNECNPWSWLSDSIKIIEIAEGVTNIGSNAFRNCSQLDSIILPSTLEWIGDNAFRNCNNLKSIVLPSRLKETGYSVFRNCTSLTSVKMSNSITYIENSTFANCSSLTEITIPNSVKTIGYAAFEDCVRLGKVQIGSGVETIAENAFAGCTRLYDVYCYATYPPFAEQSSFANYNVYLYVPCESIRNYTLDVVWGNFKFIECIESEDVTTEGVVVTPSTNDVTITWPTEAGADSYTIVIKKGDTVFCTLTFNADGQLLNIAFAPSRDGNHPAQYAKQAGNGYRFTVTGLEEGTDYSYNLVIKDNSGKTLQTYSGEFRTQSTNDRTVTVEYDAAQGQVTGAGTYLVGDTVTLTAIPNDGYRFVRWSNDVEDNPYSFVISENVMLSAEFEIEKTAVENISSPTTNCQKIIRDGQLYIYHNGSTYNVMGVIVE